MGSGGVNRCGVTGRTGSDNYDIANFTHEKSLLSIGSALYVLPYKYCPEETVRVESTPSGIVSLSVKHIS